MADSSDDREPVPAGAVDLIGQIVSANVSNLAFTTDRLIEGLERDAARFAQYVVDIDRILAEATVVDRATEGRLRLMDGSVNMAYDYLERKGALL